MKIDGSCHCGKIAYDAKVEPGKVIICHCTDCQKLTGSAYRPTIHAPAARRADSTGSSSEKS